MLTEMTLTTSWVMLSTVSVLRRSSYEHLLAIKRIYCRLTRNK